MSYITDLQELEITGLFNKLKDNKDLKFYISRFNSSLKTIKFISDFKQAVYELYHSFSIIQKYDLNIKPFKVTSFTHNKTLITNYIRSLFNMLDIMDMNEKNYHILINDWLTLNKNNLSIIDRIQLFFSSKNNEQFILDALYELKATLFNVDSIVGIEVSTARKNGTYYIQEIERIIGSHFFAIPKTKKEYVLEDFLHIRVNDVLSFDNLKLIEKTPEVLNLIEQVKTELNPHE